jgi:hypothetical protein
MGLGNIAGAVGKGLAAGLAGTVAMTVSSTTEARIRGREGSSVPAQALERTLRVVPETQEAEQRLAQLSHYGYGTAWGAVRGLIAGLGIPRRPGTVLHGALVWGSEQVLLPRLDLSPPLWEWGATEIAIDGWHHLVYVLGTDVAYAYLDRE